MANAYTLFPSEFGDVGLAWNDQAIIGLQLPDLKAKTTAKLCAERFAAKPTTELPKFVTAAIDLLQRFLGGEDVDLKQIKIDIGDVTEFTKDVLLAAREIPFGDVWTYKSLATKINRPLAVRAVGGALGRNPLALIIPCHRITASNGLGGFTSPQGTDLKQRLLRLENSKTCGSVSTANG